MSNLYIDRTLYHTTPSDANRLPKELETYNLLDQLQIPYTRVDHGPAATIEDCNEVDALLDLEICKNLFLCNSSKTNFYLLMIPGNKKFITKALSKELGCSRLSFAPYDLLEAILNLTPGSVTALGLMYDTGHQVQLLIDQELLVHEYFGCHPCINTSSLKIMTYDLIHKFLPHTGHTPIYVSL